MLICTSSKPGNGTVDFGLYEEGAIGICGSEMASVFEFGSGSLSPSADCLVGNCLRTRRAKMDRGLLECLVNSIPFLYLRRTNFKHVNITGLHLCNCKAFDFLSSIMGILMAVSENSKYTNVVGAGKNIIPSLCSSLLSFRFVYMLTCFDSDHNNRHHVAVF